MLLLSSALPLRSLWSWSCERLTSPTSICSSIAWFWFSWRAPLFMVVNRLKKTRNKSVHGEGVCPLAYRRVRAGPSDVTAIVRTFELVRVSTKDSLLNVIREALPAKRVSAGQKTGVVISPQANAAHQIVILEIIHHSLCHPFPMKNEKL